jgi:uncharacterized membrane protein YhaH (DUF805 family)
MEENILTGVGRIRRKTYWTRWLICILIQIAFTLVMPRSEGGIIMGFFISMIITIYLIIQAVKRLHDCDKSGWFILVPIYNLVLLLTDGTVGPNDYGDDPKERLGDPMAMNQDGNIALERELYPNLGGPYDQVGKALFMVVVANVAVTIFWMLFNLIARNNYEIYETLRYIIIPLSIITAILVPVLGAVYTRNPSHKKLFIALAIIIGLFRIIQEIAQ